MSKVVLVTGGAGFIGTNFIRHVLSNSDFRIVCLDALTYAANTDLSTALRDEPRHRFVHGRIDDPACVDAILAEETPAFVVNFAAETHVDRSIAATAPFVQSNVVGAESLLASCLKFWERAASPHRKEFRFLQISTDEVYGDIEEGASTESDPFAPNSPYSASKAAAEHFARAYWMTYGLPTVVARPCNNFGPYQFPEKLIPTMISRSLRDEDLPVYGDGLQKREWIFAEDTCRALMSLLAKGEIGESYNIGTGIGLSNLDVVKNIVLEVQRQTGRSCRSSVQLVKDRPGHDRRYSLDSRKLRSTTAFEPAFSFDSGLQATVAWYCEHQDWLHKRLAAKDAPQSLRGPHK